MTIYEHRTSLTISSGSIGTTTLKIFGGLGRQLLIRANTASTVFRSDLEDDQNIVRRNYDFHTGELNDMDLQLPLVGNYRISITNISSGDTFRVILAVQE